MKTLLGLHQQISRFDGVLTEWGGSLMSLVLRCYVGWQFFKAGMIKVSDWSATLALFHDEYKVPVLPPDLAAYMGAGGELTFPILLFVGLISRPPATTIFTGARCCWCWSLSVRASSRSTRCWRARRPRDKAG